MALRREVLEAVDPASLAEVERRLRDARLPLDRTLAAARNSVWFVGHDGAPHGRVPLRARGPLQRYQRLSRQVVLEIDHIRFVTVVDDARLGVFDLASIRFEAETSAVVIQGRQPVIITCRVDQIRVRAELTDAVVPGDERWGLRRRTD